MFYFFEYNIEFSAFYFLYFFTVSVMVSCTSHNYLWGQGSFIFELGRFIASVICFSI